MAGLSETGFVAKRLSEILNDQRLRASEIFKDLLQDEDDFVDTSDVSTIGRFIGLFSVENERVWQELGFLWGSLDPETATGYALDVLGKLQGVPRLGQTQSTGMVVIKGTNGITVPFNSQIVSSITNSQFLTSTDVVLVPIDAIEIDIEVLSVLDETDYVLNYSISSTSTATITYTSDASATTDEILAGIASIIIASHPQLTVVNVGDGLLTIRKTDIYNSSDFSVSTNLTITKVAKSGNVRSKDFGPIAAEAGTLTGIGSPISGWDSVYNPARVSQGSFRETDVEYRFRLYETKLIRASNLIDALYSNLINLTGVESVTIYENETDAVDENGLAAHSFMPVVLGGESQAIADTIWLSHPAGIRSQGTSTATVVDSQSFPRVVRFQRPTPVNIYVIVEVEKDPAVYPIGGDEAMVAAIVNWAKEEYTVGKDVIASRLYTPANEVDGHKIINVFIGTSPTPTTSDDIEINYIDIASISSVNVSIVGVTP